MNILIFVMTILLVLSLMTYSRLESYRNSQAFQMIFKDYMQDNERAYINARAEKMYDSIKVSEKKDGKAKPKINASPRINISLFFEPTRENKLERWQQTKVLFKKLIQILYDKQPFYEQMKQERPLFVDDLIKAITQVTDQLPKERKPKTPSDLANLKLEDPQLDSVLYKMLHGASYENTPKEEFEKKSFKNTLEGPEISEDNGDTNQELFEFKSPEGYYSILDFITTSTKLKIRVYLAPKEVLQAIFHDITTVEAIIEARQRLYQQAVADTSVEELNNSFKNQFLSMKDPEISAESLDFSVSKTNPKSYQ